MPRLLPPLALWAPLLVASTAHAAPMTIISEDMSSGAAAFSTFLLSLDETDGNLSFNENGLATGGNPDDRLAVEHIYDAVASPDGNPDGYDIQTWHSYQLFTWNPLVDGVIQSLGFSIDVQSAVPIDVGFTVDQGGGGSAAGFTSLGATTGYETITANLTGVDFGFIDFVAGDPLTFGFTVSSIADGSSTDDFPAVTLAFDFDNFIVSVDATPALPLPAPVWLLAAGLLGLGWRRRSSV